MASMVKKSTDPDEKSHTVLLNLLFSFSVQLCDTCHMYYCDIIGISNTCLRVTKQLASCDSIIFPLWVRLL